MKTIGNQHKQQNKNTYQSKSAGQYGSVIVSQTFSGNAFSPTKTNIYQQKQTTGCQLRRELMNSFKKFIMQRIKTNIYHYDYRLSAGRFYLGHVDYFICLDELAFASLS